MTQLQRNNIVTLIDPVKLDRLAEVAVKVGLQLAKGQDLLITAPVAALPLVRRIAEHAYKAGAGLVMPFFSDEEITLSRYRFGPDESFDRAAGWLYEGMAKAFGANTARLAVRQNLGSIRRKCKKSKKSAITRILLAKRPRFRFLKTPLL